MSIKIKESVVSVIDGCWTNYHIYDDRHPDDRYYVDGLSFFIKLQVWFYKNLIKRKYGEE